MPQVKHTTPCPECPFRRKSVAGWLGAATPREFIASTMGEEHMPCHSTIDYEQEDWSITQYPTAPFCAGSLVFLRNTCKAPVDRTLAAAVRQVEQNPEEVFSFPFEFLKHHEG